MMTMWHTLTLPQASGAGRLSPMPVLRASSLILHNFCLSLFTLLCASPFGTRERRCRDPLPISSHLFESTMMMVAQTNFAVGKRSREAKMCAGPLCFLSHSSQCSLFTLFTASPYGLMGEDAEQSGAPLPHLDESTMKKVDHTNFVVSEWNRKERPCAAPRPTFTLPLSLSSIFTFCFSHSS